MDLQAKVPRKYNLHIIIFSSLESHAGGRETWLNNFIPKLLSKKEDINIYIYFFPQKKVRTDEMISIIQNQKIKFIPIKLFLPKGKFFTFIRVIYFWIVTVAIISIKHNGSNTIMGIGSFYEGISVYLTKFLSGKRNLSIIWIRGIWKKESSSRIGCTLSQLFERIEIKILKKSDVLISNGEDTKKYYEYKTGKDITSIPNSINQDNFLCIKRTAFSRKKIIISYIGRLTKVKGLECFLNSIEYFNRNFEKNNINFEIVGDGDLIDTVKLFSESNKNIFYIGKIPNQKIPSYLENIDAGVCLTYSGEEGGGGVSNGFLELIAAKRLVIAWDSEIFRQVLDFEQAFFVKENDYIALAEVYMKCIKEKNMIHDKIESAYKSIEKYSFNTHTDNFLKIINNIS
uniref:glycosyltransferase n=1 Tax=Candidatus Electronema sp. TaxID=2698783 RepID=UPI00405767E7